jgi:hypothetical protein
MLVTTICPACGKSFLVDNGRLGKNRHNEPCCSRRCAGSIMVRPPKHGHRQHGFTKEYRAWTNMRTRCNYPGHIRYHRYGGRGIKVYEEWDKPLSGFEAFLAYIGAAPSPRHTVGRIDSDGHYEPGNVEWQTTKKQGNNTSRNLLLTAFGKTQTAREWAEELGISYTMLVQRKRILGWSDIDTLTQPNKRPSSR